MGMNKALLPTPPNPQANARAGLTGVPPLGLMMIIIPPYSTPNCIFFGYFTE